MAATSYNANAQNHLKRKHLAELEVGLESSVQTSIISQEQAERDVKT